MKRLTDANHYVGNASVQSLVNTERGIEYDRNGNILALKRYGPTGLDNDITFVHDGNRMTSLTDACATGSDAGAKAFSYDDNGNLTSDGRKGLDLSWNIINLPNSVVMYGGSLTYCWLSDGTKVSVKTDDGAGDGIRSGT